MICAALLGACQTHRRSLPSADPGRRTDKEIAAWVKANHLVQATAREVAAASTTEAEASFVANKASSPNGRLRVVFKIGVLRPGLKENNYGPQTTTSSYEVTETHTGKVVARVPSTLSDPMNRESRNTQKIWFTADDRVLINEEWGDGACSHYFTALISPAAGKESWNVKYLAVPEFGDDEFHGPRPVGIIEDNLLFAPFTTGKIYKKPLRELPEARPPLPFTIG